MTADKIKTLVDRGLEIVAQLATLEKEKKAIDEALATAGLDARADHVELEDAEREGRRWLARGTQSVVPVIFTADLLVKSFAPKSDVHTRIALAGGDHLGHFYAEVPKFETQFDSGKIFRREADAMLGTAAPAFITACLQRGKGGMPKSAVKIEWGSAEAAK